jgi:hypothetical protein
LDVVAAGAPVADFAEFVAVREPEGDLFDDRVFEIGGKAAGWGDGVDGMRTSSITPTSQSL